jgi:hypothetical protein
MRTTVCGDATAAQPALNEPDLPEAPWEAGKTGGDPPGTLLPGRQLLDSLGRPPGSDGGLQMRTVCKRPVSLKEPAWLSQYYMIDPPLPSRELSLLCTRRRY